MTGTSATGKMVTMSSDCPSGIIKLLKLPPYEASPEFFAHVTKINDHYQSQKRIIVLARNCFYNIKRSFFGSYSVKRVIKVSCIEGIIRNQRTQEFVIKVNSLVPNDYRYQGDCMEALTSAMLKLSPGLPVWTMSSNLDIYVKKKTAKRESGLWGTCDSKTEQSLRDSETESNVSTSSWSKAHFLWKGLV